MNEQSSQLAPDEFPNGAARHGKVYVMETAPEIMNDDGTHQRIVVMSEQSWVEFGTQLETLRRVAKAQDEKIKELLGTVAARDILNAQAMDRLNALRDVRRKEKRAEIEGDLVLPGSEAFLSTQRN
jgi:predicted dinucleotide-utilizing enzyme